MRLFKLTMTALVVNVLFFLTTPLVSSSTPQSSKLNTSGTVNYHESFFSKGTNVAINVFHPNALNYQSEAWIILKELEINIIRVWGGTEGDLHHLNILEYPNEWAQNLDGFLSEAYAHDIKVIFSQLGNEWGTLFGIVCPEPYKNPPIEGTPANEAKVMIDKLAGNNPLGRNFLIDEGILAWSVANEVDLGNEITRNWCIQILDHIRSKGGKAYMSCPYDSRAGRDWLGNLDFRIVEPILRGHVDYLAAHIYRVPVAADAQQQNKDVYNVMYEEFRNIIQEYMIDGRASMPLDNLMIGEFGLWYGYENANGISFEFTEETRGAYYRAMYQAAKDLGIRHIFNYYCFGQRRSDATYVLRWEVVDVDGTYFTHCTSVMQEYYKQN